MESMRADHKQYNLALQEKIIKYQYQRGQYFQEYLRTPQTPENEEKLEKLSQLYDKYDALVKQYEAELVKVPVTPFKRFLGRLWGRGA